ncbi:hypothetical protein GDO81_013099 [Engystomops pustulosus]|uniref:UBZ1-type domain-containing protein n=1 Tax=Engystomops pustulosus TaxID=76066 RepID=A0AAV7AZ88_ENGPU|nr:hypothetical protein GDO81_013099 [Engystomops pustulosus]
MDFETEKPPTSIISPEESNFSKVIFINVKQSYPPNTDVRCKFCKDESFICNPKDWIGIFKVGWKTTREYFTWISTRNSVENTVLFTAYYLPKDDDDYQFCYVDHNGEVRGASTPFQFRNNNPEDEDDIMMVTSEIEMKKLIEENVELQKLVTKVTEERSVLHNENENQKQKIQNLQDDLVNLTEKLQRLEPEYMELTVQSKNLEEDNKTMKQTIQSLDSELQMQRRQEEKLLLEIKEMEKINDNLQEEKKHFEKLQSYMKTLEEEKEKLESALKLHKEREIKYLSDKEELEKSLEKSVAEKCFFQLQTLTLEREKKQKESLKQSLDKELKKAFELERMMEQKNEKLRSAEERITSLSKQVDVIKAESENKMKQMGGLHITIANLEGEMKRLKDECKGKQESERTVRELRAQLQYIEEKNLCLEQQLVQQQDIHREQGEEILMLRTTIELREAEIQDMKGMEQNHRIEIDELHSRLLERTPDVPTPPNQSLIFGNPYQGRFPRGSQATSTRQPSSPLQCPMCPETFLPHQRQILEDHVMCHLDGDEARQ